jgi:hypothetical protein
VAFSGAWNYSNFEELLGYVQSNNISISYWELGMIGSTLPHRIASRIVHPALKLYLSQEMSLISSSNRLVTQSPHSSLLLITSN